MSVSGCSQAASDPDRQEDVAEEDVAGMFEGESIFSLINADNVARMIQGKWRQKIARRRVAARRAEKKEQDLAAAKMQAIARRRKAKSRVDELTKHGERVAAVLPLEEASVRSRLIARTAADTEWGGRTAESLAAMRALAAHYGDDPDTPAIPEEAAASETGEPGDE